MSTKPSTSTACNTQSCIVQADTLEWVEVCYDGCAAIIFIKGTDTVVCSSGGVPLEMTANGVTYIRGELVSTYVVYTYNVYIKG